MYFGARTILNDIILIELKCPGIRSSTFSELRLKSKNKFMLNDMAKTIKFILGIEED